MGGVGRMAWLFSIGVYELFVDGDGCVTLALYRATSTLLDATACGCVEPMQYEGALVGVWVGPITSAACAFLCKSHMSGVGRS